MQESLESVKSIPIQQVARRLGLEVIGQSARCFSHKPDRNPSLRLNLNTNRYHCYVCRGIYGSVIDLVMQVLGCDFKEAVSYLRGERQPLPPARPRRSEAERPVLSAERKGELLEAFMKFAPMQEEGMDYLRSRGLKTEIIEQMKIGYLRPGQYASASWALSRRYGFHSLKSAGLTNFYLFEKQKLPILLFPYRVGGAVQLIQARCLLTKAQAEVRQIKRFAATGWATFFYNHDEIGKASILFLCEGEIDTLTLLQLGFSAIGSPGSWGFNEAWLNLFIGKTVVLCLDADPAGEKAAAWLSEEFRSRNVLSLKLYLPVGSDINEHVRKGGYLGITQSGATQS
ncbi:MAG: toprim domain-containing protein [Candidatus Manganitrophus sp. SA1]|nr:toprim domain-containing protein [Candidatus Manganitrophus morganii]